MAVPKIRKDFQSIVKESDKAILFRDFDKQEYWVPKSLISLVKKKKDENDRPFVMAVIAAFKFEEITQIKVEEMDKVFIPSGGKVREEFKAEQLVVIELTKAIPFYYQKQMDAVMQGIELKYQALFCDPRTGKTIVSLTIAVSRLLAGLVDHIVVVCPASLQENWKRDFKRYYPQISEQKFTVLSVHSLSFDSSMSRIIAKFKAIQGRKQVIYDESHLIKNHSAKRTRNAEKYLDSDYAMALTGTEVERSLADTYHQYGVMDKNIIGAENYHQFAKNFMLYGGRDGEQIVAYQNTAQFGEMVSPLTTFLRLHEVDPEIPVPIEKTVYYDMTNRQQQAFKAVERLIDQFSDKNGWMPDAKRYQIDSLLHKISVGYIPSEDELKNLFANIGKLGEAADNLSRIKDVMYDEQNQRIEELSRLVNQINGPVVIWCVYRDEVKAIKNYFPKAGVIQGGMGAKKISKIEKDFQEGKYQIMICNEALSLGFTLDRADNVIFFNASMSRTQRFQSYSRCLLLGKHRQLYIWDIVARNGFDVRVREILNHKLKIGKVFRNEDSIS